jgi:hypothetical protein
MIGSQFIFVHIPRTGGTSLERLLLSLESIDTWEAMHRKKIVDQLVGPVKHYRASRVQALAGQALWDKALKISIIRNPFDKVISHFFQPYYRAINALSGNSLELFLTAYCPAPHEDGLTCNDYLDREVDVLIRYESYADQLFELLSPMGVRHEQIMERIGAVRQAVGYRKYFSSRTRGMVEKLYHDDIARFNYEF